MFGMNCPTRYETTICIYM